MDKILGEVFDDYVRKQIEVRQRSLGKTQKDVDDLQVFNASTPWIRLSSPISITDTKAEKLSQSLGISKDVIAGSKLARNLVLFAGTTSYTKKPNQPLTQDPTKGGVGYGLNNAYGFLSDKEQGYKPMPGVTGITTTYKNNGSLKQAQVNITCFTRKQFEALEALYLRLGYTVVLEWGHSVYFDNQGVKQNMSSLSIPNKLFSSEEDLKPKPIQDGILKNKKETGGNYDGMVAKVSNFSWNLNNDLSYSITLDLISVGDIIDSLKMNVGTTGNSDKQDAAKVNVQVAAGIQNITTIELNKSTSKLNTLLYELVQELTTKKIQKEYSQTTQDLLVFRDAAIDAADLIPVLRSTYIAATKDLIEKNTSKFQEVRLMLQQGVLSITKLNSGIGIRGIASASFNFQNTEQQKKFINSLVELKYTVEDRGPNEVPLRFVRKNPQTGEREINPDINYNRFLSEFSLQPAVEASSTGDVFTIIERTPKSTTLSNKESLLEGLNRVLDYFTNLRVVSIDDPEKNNTGTIIWLGNRLKIAKSRIVKLLDTGYFDSGKLYAPKGESLKLDRNVFKELKTK